jgi:hypothetical protein
MIAAATTIEYWWSLGYPSCRKAEATAMLMSFATTAKKRRQHFKTERKEEEAEEGGGNGNAHRRGPVFMAIPRINFGGHIAEQSDSGEDSDLPK